MAGSRNKCHARINGFVNDTFQLLLPIFDDVRFIGRPLVSSQVCRYMMIDNARKPTGGDSRLCIQCGATRKKDQLPVDEGCVAGFMDVAEQRVASAVDVVGNGLAGDGYILRAGRCPGSLGEISGQPWPEYVGLALEYLLNVRFEHFVIPDRHLTHEVSMRSYF